jgi:SPP1 family predicted phage head-tail adaptor
MKLSANTLKSAAKGLGILLSEQCTIENPSKVDSDFGKRDSFLPAITSKCSISRDESEQRFQAGAVQEAETVRIFLPRGTDIRSKARVTYAGLVYEVVGVKSDPNSVELLMMANLRRVK